ncbi:TrkH family potassium uptake protein [Flexibacterium corallicola]|uniref:TrkH family potassium uptake protein n=1 Tax=Flexibacterium corallicola TaxID=3037259 RepID=UPI00286F4B36|nr:TrkH family potassium uptake protein [Pseudovibrio sp. M1P-2-3]
MKLVAPVLRVLGFAYIALALLLLIPLMWDLLANNPDWLAFAFSSIIIGMIGLLLSVAMGGYKIESINSRQAFLITASAWITIPAFGALPFLGLGVGFHNAFFESVSGFTTTGSTVLMGLDSMPPGLLLWRSLTQWIGGVGIIVMASLLLPLLRIGGMQLFRTESSDKSEKIVSRTTDLVRWVMGLYVVLTTLCTLLYHLSGMSWFDALNHALTTLSSGGFSTHDKSFAYFESQAAVFFGIIFMIASGLPFVLMIKAVRRSPKVLLQDPQVVTFMAILLLFSMGVCIYLGLNNEVPFKEAFLESMFVVTSVVTTTGFGLGDYTNWGPLIIGVIMMLTFFGGCTGSTSGGIKTFRFIVFFGTVRANMKQMIRPDQVVVIRYGETNVTPDLAFSVLAFLVVYLSTVGIVTVVLTGFNLDLVTALSAAATAIGNVGPGLGPIVGPAGTFADIPLGAKWVLSGAMLLGRLELFTVLILLDPEFWR